MPPRKKAEAAEASDAADGLCPEHYPHGWDQVAENFAGVGCEHGTWTRPASWTQSRGRRYELDPVDDPADDES